MYHQPQSSPGSKDWIIGWFVAWKCLVACLFFESLQQPTCPHSRQRRRCTHVSPILKQSSQPFALGVTCRIWSRWVHCVAKIISFPMFYYKLLVGNQATRNMFFLLDLRSPLSLRAIARCSGGDLIFARLSTSLSYTPLFQDAKPLA